MPRQLYWVTLFIWNRFKCNKCWTCLKAINLQCKCLVNSAAQQFLKYAREYVYFSSYVYACVHVLDCVKDSKVYGMRVYHCSENIKNRIVFPKRKKGLMVFGPESVNVLPSLSRQTANNVMKWPQECLICISNLFTCMVYICIHMTFHEIHYYIPTL